MEKKNKDTVKASQKIVYLFRNEKKADEIIIHRSEYGVISKSLAPE